ncbi:MAG: tetratricopeptide repeat protein [Deltaproteobacteria bacterium]|nr:tetratricopeptide repeat protein [Deltaproteobacteria bacterium]
MKKIPIFLFLLFFIASSISLAATKTFVKDYTYQAGEADSKISCRSISLEQVKRLLLEELGVFLIGETSVKNFQITKDEIITLSAGIVSAEIIDEKWDGKSYWLRAKIAADPDEVARSIDIIRKDETKTRELEGTKKKADEALKEIARLKKELQILKSGSIKVDKKQEQYNQAVKDLSATDWFDKGLALSRAWKSQLALEAFSKAIELSPAYYEAYYNRGVEYEGAKEYRRAITDFDKVIELYPTHKKVFYNRGDSYFKLGDYRKAAQDFETQLTSYRSNIDQPVTAYNCAISFYNAGEYNKAITYFDWAFALGYTHLDEMHFYRSASYYHLGDKQKARLDAQKACDLGFKKGCESALQISREVGSSDKGAATAQGGIGGGADRSGLCRSSSDCSGFGARNCGGSSLASCGEDGLCHCCQTVCRGSNCSCMPCGQCMTRDALCISGSCYWRMGGKTSE